MAAQTANEHYGSFDPDDFDWEGDGFTSEEATTCDPTPIIMEELLKLHDQAFDWTYVRKSELRERAGRMYVAKVVMPEEHREWFEAEWPEYVFVWDKATQHHDHPVAHLCTELNEMEMVERFVREGIPYIDLFGNGNRNRKYKRLCLTLYTLLTAKDHIRYRGVVDDQYMQRIDWEKLAKGEYKCGLERIREICLTHALYYLSLSDVALLCKGGARVTALVHRHSQSHGFLNRGEQEYWVTEDGMVRQKNVLTGEEYTHPSVEGMFHQFSARTRYGGLAWTIKKMGGDSYQIQFVGCPREAAQAYVPLSLFKKETRTETTFCNTKVLKFLHWTWMYTVKGGKEYCLEDCDLFDKLRRYIAGRPRTPRYKADLLNYARRLTNKQDIIAIHGGGAHEINVARISDYVEASFYVDARHELEVALSYMRENATVVEALNAYYETGTIPMDLAKVQKAVSTGIKVVKSRGNAVAVGTAAAALGGPAAGTALGIGALLGAVGVAAVATTRTVWQEHCVDVCSDSGPQW